MQFCNKPVIEVADPKFFSLRDLKKLQEYLEPYRMKYSFGLYINSLCKPRITNAYLQFRDMTVHCQCPQMNECIRAISQPTYQSPIEEINKPLKNPYPYMVTMLSNARLPRHPTPDNRWEEGELAVQAAQEGSEQCAVKL